MNIHNFLILFISNLQIDMPPPKSKFEISLLLSVSLARLSEFTFHIYATPPIPFTEIATGTKRTNQKIITKQRAYLSFKANQGQMRLLTNRPADFSQNYIAGISNHLSYTFSHPKPQTSKNINIKLKNKHRY